MAKHKEIYKKDSNGNTRVWWLESEDDKFRVHSGVLNGQIVVSGWTVCEPKNTGKKNATTAEQQCLVEVEANYKKKLAQGNYKESPDTVTLNEDNFFKPMLAKEYGEDGTYVSGSTVYSQAKLDGLRCIATIEGLFSRQGKPIVSVPHVHRALQTLFQRDPDLILDGELYSDRLSDNFNEIISLARKSKPTNEDFKKSEEMIGYWVYDVPSCEGGFEKRIQKLYELITINSAIYPGAICVVETHEVKNQNELDELYAKYMSQGYEGQMIRTLGKDYENKRTKQLLKRKEFKDEEFEILSVEEGLGNWAGYAKTITVKHNDGSDRVFGSGVAGTQEFTKALLAERDALVGTMVTIKYQNLTPEGIPRFPVAVKFWKTQKRGL
jgi:DNA ligase-1